MKNIARILASIFVLIIATGSMNLAVAQDYKVVQIKEQLNKWGYYPNRIYRDSDCMCGPDWFADYVFEFYVPGAYSKISKGGELKITTTNSFSDCYIKGYVSARVYTNDVIKACVGSLSVFLCGRISPNRYDVAIWY